MFRTSHKRCSNRRKITPRCCCAQGSFANTNIEYDEEQPPLSPFQVFQSTAHIQSRRSMLLLWCCVSIGKFLYVSNRGHNSIAMFRVNSETDGTLELIGWVLCEVDMPVAAFLFNDNGAIKIDVRCIWFCFTRSFPVDLLASVHVMRSQAAWTWLPLAWCYSCKSEDAYRIVAVLSRVIHCTFEI